MATARRPARMVGSRVILLLPVLAVGVGIVAVLLSGGVSPTPPATPPSGSGGELLNAVTFQEAGLVTIGLFGGVLVFWTIQRVSKGMQSMPAQFLIAAFAMFCVALTFLALVHLFVHAVVPPRQPMGTGMPTNSTGTPSPPLENNSTGNLSGPFISLPPGWPWWTPYVALGAVGLVVGGLAVPYAWARSRSVLPVAVTRAPSPAQSAVGAALDSLDGSIDPRAAIIAMYGRLLASVGGRAGPTDAKTARELARILIEGLGVSPGVAGELTDRFEEARYSTQALREDAVPRTRAALRQALDELSHPAPRRP
jgi:hypothetical protein